MTTRPLLPAIRYLIAILVLWSRPVTIHAQNIRPIRDSIGFCWNAREMDSFMRYLETDARGDSAPPGSLVAAISVHDDYLYAGRVYYPLYAKIRAKEVVIFGVTHGTVAKEIGPQSNVVILDDFEAWRGPYGAVAISPLRSFLRERLPAQYVQVNNRAHAVEHSIEALIPFLQYGNRDVKITPLMVTRMPFQRMQDLSALLAAIIADYISAHHLRIGSDIVFLMSNDADHYGPDFNNAPFGTDARAHERATSNDRRIISSCLTGDISGTNLAHLAREILPDSTSQTPIPLWCGRYPVTLGLLTVSDLMRRLGKAPLRGSLMKYSDSFTEGVLPVRNTSMGLTAVFSYEHWCGWFTEGFYAGESR